LVTGKTTSLKKTGATYARMFQWRKKNKVGQLTHVFEKNGHQNGSGGDCATLTSSN